MAVEHNHLEVLAKHTHSFDYAHSNFQDLGEVLSPLELRVLFMETLLIEVS